jgi:hypothetical protein
MGHIMKDCPSHRAFIAMNDGGYVSASDIEDDLALATNHVAYSESEENHRYYDCCCGQQIYSCAACVEYTA